jgi:hypothetical protein
MRTIDLTMHCSNVIENLKGTRIITQGLLRDNIYENMYYGSFVHHLWTTDKIRTCGSTFMNLQVCLAKRRPSNVDGFRPIDNVDI